VQKGIPLSSENRIEDLDNAGIFSSGALQVEFNNKNGGLPSDDQLHLKKSKDFVEFKNT